MRTIDQVIADLPNTGVHMRPLPAPPYTGSKDRPCVGLAVPSMRNHTSNEGWELFQGLEHAGFHLWGHGIPVQDTIEGRLFSYPHGVTDVAHILRWADPGVVVLQDKREWEGKTAGRGFNPRERFTNVHALKDRTDVFKLTVLKDAHQDLVYHMQSAQEIDCHAWIVYYHPRLVNHLAPYTRRKHLIRVHHTVNAALVPPYSYADRAGCLLSGAVSEAYPLRSRLIRERSLLYGTDYLPHPGYRRDGCRTPQFLKTLSKYRVAICTSSIYGYALRKLVEGVAAGCAVITDLPTDDVLPFIDEGLVRVSSNISTKEMADLVSDTINQYDSDKQEWLATAAQTYYDHRISGLRLANQIEAVRRIYNA